MSRRPKVSRGEECDVHGLRHYEVRLRRSRRTPYVVVRRLLIIATLALFIFLVLRVSYL